MPPLYTLVLNALGVNSVATMSMGVPLSHVGREWTTCVQVAAIENQKVEREEEAPQTVVPIKAAHVPIHDHTHDREMGKPVLCRLSGGAAGGIYVSQLWLDVAKGFLFFFAAVGFVHMLKMMTMCRRCSCSSKSHD